LVPIAPLEQLLAGIHAGALNGPQLAIATGTTDSSLLLLGTDGSYSTIAVLPSLRLAGTSLEHHSASVAMQAVLAA
jgi:hypothetical protein